MRSVVVLPHPDGPSIEKNSPSAMSRERSSTAATSPNNFVTRSRRTSISFGTRSPSSTPAHGTLSPADGEHRHVSLRTAEPSGSEVHHRPLVRNGQGQAL